MNIYVANLASNVSEEDLKEVFGRYGQVNSAKIIIDFNTGQSKGFGFVEMSNQGGEKAIEELNGAELNGNELVVSEAYEKRNNNRNKYRDNNYRDNDRRNSRGGSNYNSNYGRGYHN